MRILQVLRAPVGGLFRHVRDLATHQATLGHQVGALVDVTAFDSLTEERLRALEPHLALGLHRTEIARGLAASDVTGARRTRSLALELGVDIVHGHGAKGGAFARLATGRGAPFVSFYTPHGGSLNYKRGTAQAAVFMGLERLLAGRTGGIVFESAYSREVFYRRVGRNLCRDRVIHNGLLPEEFGAHDPAPDARDLVFIGELRPIKGVDVLLRAMAEIHKVRPVSAVIVGEGPNSADLKGLASELGLLDCVTFPGALPAQRALTLGRAIAVPSRAESFPYVCLEAAARGVPMISTDVGGIGEIVAGTSTRLIPSDDVAALAGAITDVLDDPLAARLRALELQARAKQRFSVDTMTSEILAFYDAVRSTMTGVSRNETVAASETPRG